MKKLICFAVLAAVLCTALSVLAGAATVFDFSDIDEISKWTFKSGMLTDPDTGKMPQMTDEDGTVFMRTIMPHEDYPKYERVLSSSEYVDLSKNPYFVMRYRRDYPTTLGLGSSAYNHNTYFSTDYLDSNPQYQYAWWDGMLIPFGELKNNDEWEIAVFNMNDYTASHTSELKGDDKSHAAPNPAGKHEWRGNLRCIMVQPSTKTTANVKMDYELMAFASTENEAYRVLADKACSMIAKCRITNDDVSGNVSKSISEIAKRYGFTVQITETGAFTDATLTSDGSITVSYTLAVNNYSFSYTTVMRVTLPGPDEPLIWRFNNDEVNAVWKPYTDVVPSISDGVRYTEYHPTRKVDGHHFTPDETIYLQQYPYVKIKFKYTGSFSHMQVYFPNDTTSGNIYYQPALKPAENTWTTFSHDFSSVSAYPVSGGSHTGPYSGKMNGFNFWIWNNAGEGYSEIEYIAMFPAGEEGRRAWLEFDSEEPQVKGSSDKYLPGYSTAKEIFDSAKEALLISYPAVDTAQKAALKVQEVMQSAMTGVTVHKLTVGTAVETKDGYNVPVTLEVGESANTRTVMTETLSVLNTVPEPVVWEFNNPVFVYEWESGSDNSKVFFDSENGNGFMSVDSVGEDRDSNVARWKNIPEEYRFELAKYPYVKFRYRATHGGVIQFYYSTTDTANAAGTHQYRHIPLSSVTGDWTEVTVNIAEAQGGGEWSGTLDFMHLISMRYTKAKKNIDFDYIGFFATEEQAAEYSGAAEGDQSLVNAALNKIDPDVFDIPHIGVSDGESAGAKVEELLKSADIPENVTVYVEVQGYTATDPALKDGMVGKYAYTVYFLNGPLTSSAVAVYNGLMPLSPNPQIITLGAQYRSDGNTGIRFGTKIIKNDTFSDADITNVSYGTVIAPESIIPEGEMLTLETEGAADVKGDKLFFENDEYFIYTAVIHSVPFDRADVRFAARPYVKYTFDGRDYVCYSDSVKVRSMKDIKELSVSGYTDEPDITGKKLYNNEIWMKPLWSGEVVYHELFWPVMPRDAEENDELVIDLLYPISDVLTVKNGTNTVDYAEGRDYYVNEKGQLVIPCGSAIKVMKFNEYVSDKGTYKVGNTDEKYKHLTDGLIGKYLYFNDSAVIQETLQYSVTYRHTAEWSDVSRPDENYNENVLNTTRSKLEGKMPLRIAFFGDSKTAGGNNTGNFGTLPLTPKWSVMMVDRLKALYGYGDITIINRAVGGMGSYWGANGDTEETKGTHAYNLFKDDAPDLFILAYGGNDYSVPRDEWKANISSIVEQILRVNPDCEFILVPSAFSNPMWTSVANHEFHQDVLEELVDEFSAKGVSIDCARLRSVMDYIMTIKPYRDVSGNNLNHQNDLHARLIAQTVLAYITDRETAE